MKGLLADYQPLHSDFQIDAFIISSCGGTPYGAYIQAMRETIKRIQAIATVLCDAEVSPKLIQDETTKPSDTSNQSMSANKIRLAVQVMELADTCRELVRFLAHTVVLKRLIGRIDTRKRQQLDVETWAHRARVSLAHDLIEHGRPMKQTLELITALPLRIRRTIVNELSHTNSCQAIIDWYMYQIPDLPSVEPLLCSISQLSVGGKIKCLTRLLAFELIGDTQKASDNRLVFDQRIS